MIKLLLISLILVFNGLTQVVYEVTFKGKIPREPDLKQGILLWEFSSDTSTIFEFGKKISDYPTVNSKLIQPNLFLEFWNDTIIFQANDKYVYFALAWIDSLGNDGTIYISHFTKLLESRPTSSPMGLIWNIFEWKWDFNFLVEASSFK